jgi:hypothetical protein
LFCTATDWLFCRCSLQLTGQCFSRKLLGSFIAEPEDWRRREEYFISTDFEDVTGSETRPMWGRGKLATAKNSAGVRVREKEMAATL